MDKEFKTVKKISVPDTLMTINVGQTILVPTEVIRTVSLRAAARRLEQKKKGRFIVTVDGLVNQTQITRIK